MACTGAQMIAVVALLLLSTHAAVHAALPSGKAALNEIVLGPGRDIDPTSFIVAFDESSLGDPAAVATIASADAGPADVLAAAAAMKAAATAAGERIAEAARAAGISVVQTRAFGHIFTGMSIKVASPEDAEKLQQQLRADPAVKDVFPVVTSQMSRIRPADPQGSAPGSDSSEDNSIHAAAASEPDAAAQPDIFGGADQATLVDQAHTEFAGEGVRVGVLDDGLDYRHPAFGSCSAIGQGTGCRVVAGHDFTDGDDVTFDTCGSHGTHVAGIIAGDSNPASVKRSGGGGRARANGGNKMNVDWKGVAYKAQLGAYRVFNCEGTVSTDWLLGALDRAVSDGMDIINLSMGTSWAAPLGLAFATRLAKQGVLVVAAAGNDGGSGLWTFGYPAAESDAIAIGSTDNRYSLGAEIRLDSDIRIKNRPTSSVDATARAYMGSPLLDLPKQLVLAKPLNGCEGIKNKAEIAGKVAVVMGGNCTDGTKASNLLEAGAASVLFFDHNPPPAFKGALTLGANIADKPPQMFATDLTTGKALVAALSKGQAISITKIESKQFLNPNADGPSWFSSWGPDIKMRMLPTFSAPGGGILSSIPGNNFATMQGTSMATPFASGSLALWVEAQKAAGTLPSGRAKLAAARSAFINTALPVEFDDEFVHPVVRVGSGLVQVKAAIDNTVNVFPSQLLLPSGAQSTTITIALTNTGSEVRRYKLQHKPALAVSTADAWYEQERQVKQAAAVTFLNFAGDKEISTVTVPAGTTYRFKVSIAQDKALMAAPLFFSGYLYLQPAPGEGKRRRAAALDGVAADAADDVLLAEEAAVIDDLLAGEDEQGARHLLQDVAEQAIAAEPSTADYPPLSIPYQGLSQAYSKLPVVANPRPDVPESAKLAPNAALLCNILTSSCVNAAGRELQVSSNTVSVGFIGFALSLTRPVESVYVEIYNAATNKLLGRTGMSSGPIGWQGPKRLTVLPIHATASYWQGEFTPIGASSKQAASIGEGSYRFVVVIQKPVAVADEDTADPADYLERINVQGKLVVSDDVVDDPFGRH